MCGSVRMGVVVEINGRRLRVVPPAGARWLVSDLTGWKHDPLELTGPLEVVLPRRAYFEYAFLDGAGKPFADPDNPNRAENPWHDYARAVRLEGAPTLPEYPESLRGRVERITVGSRRLVVYEPPRPPRVCLLVFDGTAYYRIGKMAQALEQLSLDGLAVPARLVFSEPRRREREYRFAHETERFVIDEILPRVEGAFGAVERCGLWGASLGGLAALWLALEHPNVFPLVGAQSPALKAVPGGDDAHGDPEWLTGRYQAAAQLPENIVVQTGLLEWLLAPARRLAAVLADRGALHAYREFPSGHNWYTWRIGLAEGLLDLLGGDLWGV